MNNNIYNDNNNNTNNNTNSILCSDNYCADLNYTTIPYTEHNNTGLPKQIPIPIPIPISSGLDTFDKK
jgi:hypothetical protein